MIQALSIGSLGSGVQVFGVGPDGGREATFDGLVEMSGKGSWQGYGVIQAKYRRVLTSSRVDQAWFFEQLTEELDQWVSPASQRQRRQPQYFVVATNVALSSVAQNGGIDRFERIMESYRDRRDERGFPIGLPGLLGWVVWHAERVERLLDNNSDVRQTFADLILPGDVLARLHAALGQDEQTASAAWIAHIARTLTAETSVELGESGDNANTPLPLAAVAVDLPSRMESEREHQPGYALKSLIARADNVLSPGMQPRFGDRVLVLGGPGSGKSTLSRLLCQIYRVALLQSFAQGRVTRATAEMAAGLRRAFDDGGLPKPSLHRLPIRVVLSRYADAVSRPGDKTLLHFITETINRRSSFELSPSQVRDLMKRWPALIVLDGLDEVASPEIRVKVQERVEDFLTEMAAAQVDVLLVSTSRPFGVEVDKQNGYDQLSLRPMNSNQAISYASRLLAQRFTDNPERQEETLRRLQTSAQSEDTTRLMTSPLQVTILTLLLEQRTRAPGSRFALFNAYYDIVYTRETGKASWIGELLEAHRTQVNSLHEQCALTIHGRAEHAGDAESILPLGDLERIARQLLEADGYAGTSVDKLASDLLRVARERLVLLVPRRDGVAFEVRSLAELFAARALMGVEDPIDRLEIMIPSAHWRHTWLLSAGYIYSLRTALRDAVVAALDRVDRANWANRLVMPGAELALEALLDGFAAHAPRYERQLTASALRLLDGPIGSRITDLAATLGPLMRHSADINNVVNAEVEARLKGHAPGTTRAFLSGLAGSDIPYVSAKAGARLAQFDEKKGASDLKDSAGARQTSVPSQELWAQLENVGAPAANRQNQASMLELLTYSSSGTISSAWVSEARELVVEACIGNPDLAHQMEAKLQAAIPRDSISHLLMTPDSPSAEAS